MIMMEPDNQEVSIFGPANFTCLATGEPPPTYSWFKVTKLYETQDAYYVRLYSNCICVILSRRVSSPEMSLPHSLLS